MRIIKRAVRAVTTPPPPADAVPDLDRLRQVRSELHQRFSEFDQAQRQLRDGPFFETFRSSLPLRERFEPLALGRLDELLAGMLWQTCEPDLHTLPPAIEAGLSPLYDMALPLEGERFALGQLIAELKPPYLTGLIKQLGGDSRLEPLLRADESVDPACLRNADRLFHILGGADIERFLNGVPDETLWRGPLPSEDLQKAQRRAFDRAIEGFNKAIEVSTPDLGR